MRLSERLNKPEYFFRPGQLIHRLLRPTSRLPSTAEATLPWGLQMRIRPREFIGQAIWQLGVYDLPVSEAVWRLLEVGENAVDIGANIGYMTCLMAKRVGRDGTIWSFEPHPQVFADLIDNIRRWPRDQGVGYVLAHQLALSDSVGHANLFEPDEFADNRGTATLGAPDAASNAANLHGTKAKTSVVALSTVDTILSENQSIGVLKIDVEGHELKVLQGGRKLFEENRIRDIVFEDQLPHPSPVMKFFTDNEFTIFRIKRFFSGLRLAPPEESGGQASWLPPNFIATRDPTRAKSCFASSGWQVLR